MKRLTEGGKARRILLNPGAFLKDDFSVLSIKDLADFLGTSEEKVKQYQQEASQLPKGLVKQLAKLFDDLYGNGNSYAGDDDDQDTDEDVKEKVTGILSNPSQFWDDETSKPLNVKELAKLIGLSRTTIYKYQKDYASIPNELKSRLVKLYDSLLLVDELPEPRDDYLRLLKQVKTGDELFTTAQAEIPQVIQEGLARTDVSYYTKEVLDTLVKGIKVNNSALLRILIMKMNEKN